MENSESQAEMQSGVPVEAKSEVQQLREEIAALRQEMKLLKKVLFLSEDEDLSKSKKPDLWLDTIYCEALHVTNLDTDAEITLECDESARITLCGQEQCGSVTIDSGDGETEGASVGLFNNKGYRRAALEVTKNDGGALALWHKSTFYEKQGQDGEPLPGGSYRVHLSAEKEGGEFSLYGADEKTRFQAHATVDGSNVMLCYPDNKAAIGLVSNTDGAQMVVNTPDQKNAGGLISNKKGGELMIMNSQGTQKVRVATQNEQGVVSLFGKDQNPRAALAVRPDDVGIVAVFGPDGQRRASMTGHHEGGAIEASVGGKSAQAALHCDELGGALHLETVSGQPLASIAPMEPEAGKAPDTPMGAQMLVYGASGLPVLLAGPGPVLGVLSDDGQPRIMMLGQARGGRIDLLEAGGSNRVTLDVDASGGGRVDLFNEANAPSVSCIAASEGGTLQISNDASQPQAALLPGSDGGRLHLYRHDGELGVTAAAREEGGAMEFYDEQGHSHAVLP